MVQTKSKKVIAMYFMPQCTNRYCHKECAKRGFKFLGIKE